MISTVTLQLQWVRKHRHYRAAKRYVALHGIQYNVKG